MESLLGGIFIVIGAILVVAEVITFGQLFLIILIGGPILMVIFVIWVEVEDRIEANKEEKRLKENRKKAKARREKKKLVAKKSYKETLKKLQTSKENYEQQEQPLKEEFFKDAIKLASDVGLIKKGEVDDGKSIFAILKFARLNVFSSLEDEEKAQNYADKLRASLKKLSSFDG